MKHLLLLTIIVSIQSILAMGQQNNLNIIPQPVQVQVLSGFFDLKGNASITYNQPEVQNVAIMLAQRLSIPTGYQLPVKQGNGGTIQLNINDSADSEVGNEGYKLITSSKGVRIMANKPAGLFYGMQTLLQLFPKEIESKVAVTAEWTIPAVNITDYPRFAWRGLMLDVSRNFFTKAEVEQYIDQMARFKFNTFHWHLTDDQGWRIEIKSLPRLTEVGAWRVPRYGQFGSRQEPLPGEAATYGGFYTHEDIREVVQYARDRFISVVPEIDVPGHSMAAIASYPELSCTKNREAYVNPGTAFSEWYADGSFKMLIDNTLNPSDEKVYAFMDSVIGEVAQLFPGPYIHVGGDECYKGYWEADSACRALADTLKLQRIGDLQGYFMSRVEKIVQEKGKRMIGWDEILDGTISPSTAVMSWRSVERGAEAAAKGHDVVMAPTSFVYLDYTQGDPTVDPPIYAHLRLQRCYAFDPMPKGADPKYILGGQGNLWTEQVATLHHAEYMTWPRGWALAEDFWTPNETKNWDNFERRVENQFTRSDVAEMNYSRALYDAIVNPRMKGGKIWIDLAAEVPGIKIYYTIDGGMPDRYSPEYTAPFELPDGPITLRVITYRDGMPIGHLITVKPEDIRKRAQ
jgi:hexosaminidase